MHSCLHAHMHVRSRAHTHTHKHTEWWLKVTHVERVVTQSYRMVTSSLPYIGIRCHIQKIQTVQRCVRFSLPTWCVIHSNNSRWNWHLKSAYIPGYSLLFLIKLVLQYNKTQVKWTRTILSNHSPWIVRRPKYHVIRSKIDHQIGQI